MPTKTNDSQRLEKFIESKKTSAYAFAKRIGTTPTRLYNVLQGRVGLSKALVLDILAVYPDADKDWLLTGKGSPPEPVKEPEPKHEPDKVTDPKVFERLLEFKKRNSLTYEQFAEPLLNDISVEGLKMAIKRERTEKEYIEKLIKFHNIDRDWLLEGEGKATGRPTTVDILDKIKKHYNIKNDRQLAQKINVSSQHIWNWRNRNSIDEYKLLNAFPNLNPDWLIYGEGDIEKATEPKAEISLSPRTDIHSIPIYNFEVAAGDTTMYNDQQTQIIGYLSIPGVTEKSDKAVIVRGDSMHPTYPAGTIIAVKRVTEYKEGLFVSGLAYLIETREQSIVKYLFEDKENPESFLAISENKAYPDFHIPKKLIVKLWAVKGRAVQDMI